MKLLAIDTSSVACSVALQVNEAMVERHEELPREHTRILVPMINAVLDEGDLAIKDLDAIVLGNGPGSFIGMRIAASVAQGLAYGAGLDVVPVSSMAAVAAEVFAATEADEVIVAQDAHMNEIYLGRYRLDSAGMPEDIEPERLQAVAPIDNLDPETRRVAAGFGWQRYPPLATINAAKVGFVSTVQHPRAVFLLGIAANSMAQGLAIPPQDVVPAYLRQKVAEKPKTSP